MQCVRTAQGHRPGQDLDQSMGVQVPRQHRVRRAPERDVDGGDEAGVRTLREGVLRLDEISFVKFERQRSREDQRDPKMGKGRGQGRISVIKNGQTSAMSCSISYKYQ